MQGLEPGTATGVPVTPNLAPDSRLLAPCSLLLRFSAPPGAKYGISTGFMYYPKREHRQPTNGRPPAHLGRIARRRAVGSHIPTARRAGPGRPRARALGGAELPARPRGPRPARGPPHRRRRRPCADRALGGAGRGGAAARPGRRAARRLRRRRPRAARRVRGLGLDPPDRRGPAPRRRPPRRRVCGPLPTRRRDLERARSRPPGAGARAPRRARRAALRPPRSGALAAHRRALVVAGRGRLRARAPPRVARLGGLRAPLAPDAARALRRARRPGPAPGRACPRPRRSSRRAARPARLLRHLVVRTERDRGDGARRRPLAARVRLRTARGRSPHLALRPPGLRRPRPPA